jgi:hypothetical protein
MNKRDRHDLQVLCDGLDIIKKRLTIDYLEKNPLVVTALRNLLHAILAAG